MIENDSIYEEAIDQLSMDPRFKNLPDYQKEKMIQIAMNSIISWNKHLTEDNEINTHE